MCYQKSQEPITKGVWCYENSIYKSIFNAKKKFSCFGNPSDLTSVTFWLIRKGDGLTKISCTNLDAHTNYEIKCNDVNVPFVKKFTLLGVTLDEYLIFDTHTISLCAKVNWKVSVLKKSSYLYDVNFKLHYSNCLSFRTMIIVKRFTFISMKKEMKIVWKKTLPKQ